MGGEVWSKREEGLKFVNVNSFARVCGKLEPVTLYPLDRVASGPLELSSCLGGGKKRRRKERQNSRDGN